tara:strand:- start:101 stop:337 length:237 start_codon:yes stop_codon:yes gene_type:complete
MATIEMTKLKRFDNGHFRVTDIPGDYVGLASCWFDAQGIMFDAWLSYALHRGCRRVIKNGPIWQTLEIMGRVFKEKSK